MEADSRPHLPILPFCIGMQLATPCLVALSLRGLNHVVGTAALLCIIISAYGFTTGDAQRDHATGSAFATLAFTALFFSWLTDPIQDFGHERDRVAPAELPFARRVWWALCLLNSPREIGWSCEVGVAMLTFCFWSADRLTQVSNILRPPSEARWPFVRKKLMSAFRWFLFLDPAQTYQRLNPVFTRRDMDLWSQGYLMLPVNIVARFSSLVGMLAMQY